MRVRLKKHASRVDEAIDLASYVMNDYNYELQKQRILEKYHFDVFDVEKMMDSRSKIARLFQRDFQTHHEVLNFFFAKRSNAFSLARFFLKTPYFQAEKRRCRAVFYEDENRVESFVAAFKELKLIDESVDENMTTFEGLSLLLERMDIADEDKWMLQTVYLHLHGYLKRFCGLVNQIVDWLMTFEEQICQEEALFNSYWTQYVEQHDFSDYLSKRLNIAVKADTTQIWIVPSYFACSRIVYEYRQDTIMYVYIGMILDQTFSFEKKYETPSLLCGHLKLLSDPSKFEILRVIKEKSHYGSELAKIFHLSTPTISHHVQALENAGFIKSEKKDNRTYYSMDIDRLSLFLAQIHHMLIEREKEE